MMRKKFFVGLIITGLLAAISYGSDEKNKNIAQNDFSLVYLSWLYNQSAVTKKSVLGDVSAAFKGVRSSRNDIGLSFLKTTTSIGGGMEVFLSERFSLALGAELRSNSPSDSRLSSEQISTTFINGNNAFETKASLIPILATVRFNIPFQKFWAYFGAGAGLYFGKLRLNWQSPDFADERFYAKGMAIIPHFNGGLLYKLSKRISVGCDVRYVMGNFNSLTIKECLDASLVGQKLNLTDISAYGNHFPGELKGLNMGFVFRFNF